MANINNIIIGFDSNLLQSTSFDHLQTWWHCHWNTR